MSDHNFVLSDQDGVLVGDMSFQVKKIICSPVAWSLRITAVQEPAKTLKIFEKYKYADPSR